MQHANGTGDDRAELLALAEALLSTMEELTNALKALNAQAPNAPPLDERLAEYREWVKKIRHSRSASSQG